MADQAMNLFGTRDTLHVPGSDKKLYFYNLNKLAGHDVSRLPVSIRVLLESVLREANDYDVRRELLEQATAYAAEDADVTLRLWLALKPLLRERRALALYEQVERRMIAVLRDMETAGIKVDGEELARIGEFDGKSLELRFSPAQYGQIPKAHPTAVIDYVQGVDTPAAAWPYLLPGPGDAWAGRKAYRARWTVALDAAPQRDVDLALWFVDTTRLGGRLDPRLVRAVERDRPGAVQRAAGGMGRIGELLDESAHVRAPAQPLALPRPRRPSRRPRRRRAARTRRGSSGAGSPRARPGSPSAAGWRRPASRPARSAPARRS